MSNTLRTVSTLLILGLSALATVTTGALAQMRGREIVPIGRDGHAPEGRGCYWAQGRGYCRAYCYIEADGRRFCTERSRHASPQAPMMEEVGEAFGLLK